MKRLLSGAAVALLLCGCAGGERPADAAQAPVAAPAPAPAAETAAATPAAPASHDVTGAYFPMEPLPAEFAELEHLSLATIDENAAPAPLNGFLRPKKAEASDYVLVTPSLAGRRLTFTTTAHGGVRYAFDGEFQLLENFPQNPPPYETAVLTGTLTRERDGRTVASAPVRFRYEAGG